MPTVIVRNLYKCNKNFSGSSLQILIAIKDDVRGLVDISSSYISPNNMTILTLTQFEKEGYVLVDIQEEIIPDPEPIDPPVSDDSEIEPPTNTTADNDSAPLQESTE
ncbi:hypothetical protein [Ewingella americana]|uniref:Uncharacterized protein n=1 Tax=Ewingella americana TaxID=41202 RepID=A0A502GDE4_9GAMM|nr:hypothetical protein [Ewingella americana]TPG59945.1 hypothetical protein EAH77_15370 [Ewingella americana]